VPVPGPARVRRHNRPTGRTNRLWSMRTQLLTPILVATIGLIVLGTVQTRTALAESADAGRARVLAGTATATVRLVHELERELAETVALRQRGGASGRQLVNAQRQRVDAAIGRYRSAGAAARRTAPALARALDGSDVQLAQLGGARDVALGARPDDPLYVSLVDALLGVADALPAQLRNTDLANGAREVASVAAQEHFAALERDLLRAIFTRGALQEGEFARIAQLRGAQEQRQAEFSRIADPASAAVQSRLLDGSDVSTARRIRDAVLTADTAPAVLKTDGDAWYVAQSGVIRRHNLIGRELSERLDQQAAELARDTRQRALISGGTALSVATISLLAAALLAVRTSRRLRRLRVAALAMANRELPDRINAIAAGQQRGDSTEYRSAFDLTAGIARGRDEIGQVADAFDTVNRSALRLAGDQAELRVDVTRMAEALARRIRTLITRQLRLLDEFEREETDPDALARLFALDHLAARMRRNGENLLVLAGGEPGRAQHGAYLLNEVVAAAASEIEEFTRIEAELPQVAVDAAVVGNLVHLLAELLENATSYSPPEAVVRVDGRRTIDGVLIRIHDQGIGISEKRLAEINARLSAPSNLSSAAAGSMGLHVVAHLATRHHIQVSLHSTGTGTVACIEVPEAVLTLVEKALSRQSPSSSAPARTATPPAVGRPRPVAASSVPVSPKTWFAPRSSSAPTAPAWATAAPAWPAWPAAPATGQPATAAQLVRAQLAPTVALPIVGPPRQPEPAAGAPRRPAPAPGGQELPRRVRGGQLVPELPIPQPHRVQRDDPLDPELVRARLSALSEGVATAMRRGKQQTETTGRSHP
jgi:anti-sigma regulatory factor (Ser/Thr protein kinase)